MDDQNSDTSGPVADSLLPYDHWTEDALRLVVIRALRFAANSGLPGEHHFFVSFRTDHPGCDVPKRLRAQYPQEMTIVLQHQFWDLKVDEAAQLFSVGLSFGGIPSVLTVPFAALTGFADPAVEFGLRFRPEDMTPPDAEAPPTAAETAAPDAEDTPAADPTPQVVSLDAFRRRSPPKD